MRRKTLQTVLVVGMVLLAGCAGGLSGSPTTAPGDGPNGEAPDDAGTVAFYISDQPNAIGDFEHLNVTVSQVGFQQAGDGDRDDEDETDDDETDVNETEDDETDVNETDAPGLANETDTEPPETETGDEEREDDDDESDNETDADEPEADDEAEAGGWIEHDVDNRTVDLTALVGDNATMLAQFDVPNGTYNTVFVQVSEVNATLENGETVNVKLPSEKLQLNEPFTIGDGEAVDFVFDIAVHKAGNSGKYILQPVIGESGTDVPIERVDDDRDDADDEAALDASFVGEVTPGENATVAVSDADGPVGNATVTVSGERIGVTDADGRITFTVPEAAELDVEIRQGDGEAELEREFESDDGPEDSRRTPTPTASS